MEEDRLDFFKREAKKLLKDWKTQSKDGENYVYEAKFYNIDDLLSYYKFSDEDRQDIKLSKAQHVISKMAGYDKWTDLAAASGKELIYAEVLLRNLKSGQDLKNWETFKVLHEIDSLGIDSKIQLAARNFGMDNDFIERRLASIGGNNKSRKSHDYGMSL